MIDRKKRETNGEIDFSKPISGSKCCKCGLEFTNYQVEGGMARHYCANHFPENKEGWLYKKMKESYIDAMELGKSMHDDWSSMTHRERYVALEPHFISKIKKKEMP